MTHGGGHWVRSWDLTSNESTCVDVNYHQKGKILQLTSYLEKNGYLCSEKGDFIMSYNEMAQLELMNALNSIRSEAELNEFKDMVAMYFAKKAQKEIDALWDEGVINEDVIEQWGSEHMRTPYRYASNRS